MTSDHSEGSLPEGAVGGARRRRQLIAMATLLALSIAVGVAAKPRPTSPPADPPIPGRVPAASPTLRLVAPGAGPVYLSAQLDRSAVLAAGDGIAKLELVIRGDDSAAEKSRRVATDLVVVLDRSGSMEGPALDNAKGAIRALLSSLASSDRFALVTYASRADIAIPLQQASADALSAWGAEVASIRAQGGTNMSGGLDLADSLLPDLRRSGRAVRVVLISDGKANEGDSTARGLRERAARAVRGEYVLSAVGVGERFDEGLMTSMADAGTGNYYYVRRSDELGGVFAGEFASARSQLASALAVTLKPRTGVRVLDAAGYPLEETPDGVVFRPGALFAGQERRVWVTFQASTRSPGEIPLADVSLDYRLDGQPAVLALVDPPTVTCVEGEDDYYAGVDGDAWVRSSLVDGYGAVEQVVAEALRSGDRSRADAALADYARSTRQANARLQRPEAVQQLAEVEQLERQLKQAFEGGHADRNVLSKGLTATARDSRRQGSKASPEP